MYVLLHRFHTFALVQVYGVGIPTTLKTMHIRNREYASLHAIRAIHSVAYRGLKLSRSEGARGERCAHSPACDI